MSSTLLALYLGRDLVGRCDINCYGGKPDRCACVCNGLNHAVGLELAIEQTRRMADEWIESHREQGIIFDGVELGIPIMHNPLFALPLGGELGEREGFEALAS